MLMAPLHPPVPPVPHKDRIVLGMGFAFLAFFLLAIMNTFAKLLSTHHHVIEIAFYRNTITIFPLLIYFFATGKQSQLLITKRAAMVFRAVMGTIGLVTIFAAYQHLPMADATALLFTTSLMLPALSHFVLKERVGPYRWSACALGMVGVIIMAHPSGMVNMIGVSFALAGALFQAITGTMLRYLKTEPPVAVTFYFTLIGALMCALVMPFLAQPLTGNDIWLLIGTGITGGSAQLLLTSAYKYAPSSVIAPFNYLGLIWATGLDILVWDYIPERSIFIGGAIVIICNLFILYREHKNTKTKEIIAESTIQAIEAEGQI